MSDWSTTVLKLVGRLRADPTLSGARADLRRWQPGRSPSMRAMALIVAAGGDIAGERADPIFCAAQLAALLADLHPQGERPSVGAGLQSAGVSELRLERLLEASPEQLPMQLRSVGRMLAASHTPVDVVGLAGLLFERNARAERLRRRIAQDYFRAQGPQGDASHG